MHHGDIDEQLDRAERNADGSHRVILSAALPGKPLEGFMYEGTRPDDPNDVIPHENRRGAPRPAGVQRLGESHRREGNEFARMLDCRTNGRAHVRHYVRDFNATLGSAGIGLRERRDGYEYLAEFGPTKKALPAFGMYMRPWMTIDLQAAGHRTHRVEAGSCPRSGARASRIPRTSAHARTTRSGRHES